MEERVRERERKVDLASRIVQPFQSTCFSFFISRSFLCLIKSNSFSLLICTNKTFFLFICFKEKIKRILEITFEKKEFSTRFELIANLLYVF